MALVEAVLGEEHHLIEELVGDLGVNAALTRALHKDVSVLLHLRDLFLTHGPAQQVRLAQGIARQILSDLHDLLLVDHDPVGLLQDRLQLGVGEIDRLAAVLAVDEFRDQPRIEGAGSVKGQDRGDVFQGGRLEVAHDLAHPTGFQLEDAFEIAAGQQAEGAWIIEWERIGIDADARTLLNQIDGLVDHREVLEAQEVHLQQAHGLHVFHEVLGDHLPVVVALQRHNFIEGIRGNDDTSGMDAEGLVGPLNAHRHVDPTLHRGIAEIFLAELRGR